LKWLGLRLLRLAVLGTFAAVLWPDSAAAATRQLVYAVKHSVFGDIGTYTNLIESNGDSTTVRTTVHFLVSALGVGLHREDAERVERWQGDRLTAFHGITKKNGETTEVNGEASGNNFVITGPLGTVTAPGSIHTANPWSSKCLSATTMMRVDTGKVEQVRVGGGGQTTVKVDGADIPAREYQIDGATHYKIWIDQHDVPVKFVVEDDSGEVTFSLKR